MCPQALRSSCPQALLKRPADGENHRKVVIGGFLAAWWFAVKGVGDREVDREVGDDLPFDRTVEVDAHPGPVGDAGKDAQLDQNVGLWIVVKEEVISAEKRCRQGKGARFLSNGCIATDSEARCRLQIALVVLSESAAINPSKLSPEVDAELGAAAEAERAGGEIAVSAVSGEGEIEVISKGSVAFLLVGLDRGVRVGRDVGGRVDLPKDRDVSHRRRLPDRRRPGGRRRVCGRSGWRLRRRRGAGAPRG